MLSRILTTAPLACVLSFGLAYAGDEQIAPKGEHAHGDKAEKLAKFDTNHDGKLDEGERAAMRAELATRLKTKHPELFAKLDTDHDGALSKEEMHAGKKKLDEAREARGERKGKKEAGDK